MSATFAAATLPATVKVHPLVPAFHEALFRDANENPGRTQRWRHFQYQHPPADSPSFGFDTGPGNMLMDACNISGSSRPTKTGKKAAQGKILPDLLASCSTILISAALIPKYRPRLFSLSWLQGRLKGNEKPEDVIRIGLLYRTNHFDATKQAARRFIIFTSAAAASAIRFDARLGNPVSPDTNCTA